MREPWFRIVSVSERGGRSMADIVKDVAESRGLTVEDLRGWRNTKPIATARHVAWEQIRVERPDLSSSQVARYFRRDGSTVRHRWLRMERAAA